MINRELMELYAELCEYQRALEINKSLRLKLNRFIDNIKELFSEIEIKTLRYILSIDSKLLEDDIMIIQNEIDECYTDCTGLEDK